MSLSALRRGSAAAAGSAQLGPGGIGTATLKALFETGDFSEWHGGVNVPAGNAYGASVTVDNTRAYEGTRSAKAHIGATGGPAANQYARVAWGGESGQANDLNMTTGRDIWWGCAVFLPTGFYASVDGYVSFLRWDNYNHLGQTSSGVTHLGFSYNTSNAAWWLHRQRLGIDAEANVGGSTFALSENAWHMVEAHTRLSPNDGEALNEVYVDGALMGRSNTRNTYGQPLTLMRAGIVAVQSTAQVKAMDLWIDRAYIGPRQVGA